MPRFFLIILLFMPLAVRAVTLSAISLSPTSVIGGATATGTVTLSGAAPTGGALVTLQCGLTPNFFYSAAASVPANVTVASGQTQANFTITTYTVSSSTSLCVGATYGAQYITNFTVNPVGVSSVTLNPTSVTGGASSTGTVTLNGTAPTGGASVTLSSNNTSAAQTSASVTVTAGNSSAMFTVTTSAVSSTASVTITATYNGTQTATLTVNPPAVSSVSLNPASLTGGAGSTGTVTLSAAAPTGGASVTLSSNNTSAAQTPASMTVTAGHTTGTFNITTSAVSSTASVTISATYNGTQTATLTVNPPAVSSVSLQPATLMGGTASTGTVTLSGAAPTGGATVTLSSNNTSAAQTPASVTVSAGATTGTFSVTTSVVNNTTTVTITATYNGTQTSTLTVNPLAVSSVSLQPATLIGGVSSTGTVTLNGAAPAGGTTVSLSSNAGAAQVSANVTVLAGASTATFTITTSPVTGTTSATISATLNGMQTATLTINPPGVSSLSLNPSSVVSSSSSTGTVTLSGAAPTGGLTVTLSSNNTTAAQTPASVQVAAGNTSATFTITTGMVSTTATANISATNNGTQSAALTVNPLILESISLDDDEVVGGVSVTGGVTLNGPAPAGGVPVISIALQCGYGGDCWPTPAATAPDTIVVPEGCSSTTFTVTTTAVDEPITVFMIAGYSVYIAYSNLLTINPPTVAAVSLAPAGVTGGGSSTGTVTLSSPAPTGGMVVSLSSDNAAAQTPANMTVSAGSTSGTFTVTSSAVASTTTANITAATDLSSQSAALTISPPALQSLSLSPTSLMGGASTSGTVTLNGSAPTGGIVVTLSSNNAAAQLPTTVTVLAGATTATFTVTTSPVNAQTVATLTASGDGTQTANLTINATGVSGLTLSPSSLFGGATATGTVTLSGAAPTGGVVVTLASDNAAAQPPASVTVASGSTSGTFTIPTSAVSSTTTANITASYNGTQTAALTIEAPGVTGVSFSPSSVVSGVASTGTVTLSGIAPAGGASVTLSSNNTAVSLPASVTVQAGSNSATFSVTGAQVSTATAVTITAVYNGTQTATLTILPLQVSAVSLYPSYVAGGNPSAGAVTLNGPAPVGGATVELSSNPDPNLAVGVFGSIPASVTVAQNQTQATFPVTTSPTLSPAGLQIQASYNGQAAGAELYINPPGAATLTLSPSSITGGATVTGTLTLDGPAPANGLILTPSSDNTAAQVPLAVTVAAGATSATFSITTSGVASVTTVTITAGGATAIFVIDPPSVAGLTLSPSSVTGSLNSVGTVTLNGPAPPAGSYVALASDNAAATVDANVYVINGQTSNTFNIATATVYAVCTANISVTYNGGTQSAALVITPPPTISALALNPPEIPGSTTSTGTVTLSGAAPASGAQVSVASDSGNAIVTSPLLIPAGALSAVFTITTLGVNATSTANISVSYNSSTATSALTIDPPYPVSVSLAPTTLAGGDSTTGTVTLNVPAPADGLTVTLASDNAAAQPPASVTVLSGQTTATFTATTSIVAAQTTANISAAAGGGTASAALTLTPPGVDLLYQTLDGTYLPVPNPLPVGQGETMTFKAVPDPASFSWQTDQLSWSGATPGTDPTIATASFTANGTVTASYGAASATATVDVVSVSLNPTPIYVSSGSSTGVTISVTPSNAAVQFSIQNNDPDDSTEYALIDNWDAVNGLLTISGEYPGDTTLLATLPDGTLLSSTPLESIAISFTPGALTIPENGTAPAALSVSVQPDDAPVTFAIPDWGAATATLGGTAPNLTVTGLAAGTTYVQALVNGVEFASVPVTVGDVGLSASPYLLADGLDTCQIAIHLLTSTGAPAVDQSVMLTTTDGSLSAIAGNGSGSGLTMTVTSDTTGSATAMLQSSTTPGVETITGAYTDAGGTTHSGTATVTFFQPLLQTSALTVPGANVPPLYATSVGRTWDKLKVALITTPPIDLTQVQINWSGSNGTPDSNDSAGATLLLSLAPSGPALANVAVAVKASTTTMNCPAQVAVLRVTGVGVATSDQSGLSAVDSNGNLCTKVQAGQVASVQASLLPALPALQAVYNQFVVWSSGTVGATGDIDTVPCDNATQTLLTASCGSSSASATVWIAQIDLEINGVLQGDKGTQSATIPIDPNADIYPVPGDNCLVPIRIHVAPSGLGGVLTLSNGSNIGVYAASDKTGGPVSPAEWNLSLGDALPGELYLDGISASAGSPPQPQAITLNYTWGSMPTLNDAVQATVDPSATADKAKLEIYNYLPWRYIGENNMVESMINDYENSSHNGSAQYLDPPLCMTAAIVLHITLGPHEYLNGDTINASVNIQDDNTQYYLLDSQYQASCNFGCFYYYTFNDGLIYNGGSWDGTEQNYFSTWYLMDNKQWINPSGAPGTFGYDPIFNRYNSDDTVDFYSVIFWPTTAQPYTSYTGTLSQQQLEASLCAGSSLNDSFVVSLNANTFEDNEQIPSDQLDFVQGDCAFTEDGATDITPNGSGPAAQTVKVQNMTVSNVSANAQYGTMDYFKYDPSYGSQFPNPSVSFMLNDMNPNNYYNYKCWLMIQPTGEVHDNFDIGDFDYSTCNPLFNSPGDITIPWDGNAGTAAWGTYTYDVFVEKMDPASATVVDQFSFKWPYNLTVGEHNVWINPSASSNSHQDELRCNYELTTNFAICPNDMPPTNIQLVGIDGALNTLGTSSGGAVNGQYALGQEYGGNDGLLVAQTWDLAGTPRVIVIGEDDSWKPYRRDHGSERMLAVNGVSINKDPIYYFQLCKRVNHLWISAGNWSSYMSWKIGSDRTKFNSIFNPISKQLTASGNNPVILTHGMTGGDENDFSTMADYLLATGLYSDVYFLMYPTGKASFVKGNPVFNYSAYRVAEALSRVLPQLTIIKSGHNKGMYHKVDAICHCYGGLIFRGAMEKISNPDSNTSEPEIKVQCDKYIKDMALLATPNNGSALASILYGSCPPTNNVIANFLTAPSRFTIGLILNQNGVGIDELSNCAISSPYMLALYNTTGPLSNGLVCLAGDDPTGCKTYVHPLMDLEDDLYGVGMHDGLIDYNSVFDNMPYSYKAIADCHHNDIISKNIALQTLGGLLINLRKLRGSAENNLITN